MSRLVVLAVVHSPSSEMEFYTLGHCAHREQPKSLQTVAVVQIDSSSDVVTLQVTRVTAQGSPGWTAAPSSMRPILRPHRPAAGAEAVLGAFGAVKLGTPPVATGPDGLSLVHQVVVVSPFEKATNVQPGRRGRQCRHSVQLHEAVLAS